MLVKLTASDLGLIIFSLGIRKKKIKQYLKYASKARPGLI